MNKEKLDVVFVLDNSGSMGGSEHNTIASYNEYLEREKHKKYNVDVTTVLFNDHYHYLYKKKNIKEVKPLTKKEYKVGGCTALYDALGNTINYMKDTTNKVLFIIITDGMENASKEFNRNRIKRLIKKYNNFEFIYIGADIDSYEAGGSIGICRENIANYKKDAKGTKILFESVDCFEEAMMCGTSSKDWKKELDKYIDNNL